MRSPVIMPFARAALAAFAFVTTALLTVAPAAAQAYTDPRPFAYDPDQPDLLFIDGPIGDLTTQKLVDFLPNLPDVTTLVLSSETGAMVEGMMVADIVWALGLNTIVPEGSICAGPCFFVFMAGRERVMNGSLGLTIRPDPITDEYMTDDELFAIQQQALARYGASGTVTALFNTLRQTSDLYLRADEADLIDLNRTADEGDAQFDALPPPARPPESIAFYDEIRGDSGPAMLFLVEPTTETVIGEFLSETFWVIPSNGPPHLKALSFVTQMNMTIGIEFRPAETSAQPFVGDLIVIDFQKDDAAAAWIDIQNVWTFGVGDPEGTGNDIVYLPQISSRSQFLTNDGTLATRITLRMTAIYSELTRQRYAEFDAFVMAFELVDGTAATLLLQLNDEARLAFDAALSAW